MEKFSTVTEENVWVPHDYGNTFFRQPLASGDRLVIGPSAEHVDVMMDLAATWPNQQFYVLYVLLISHTGAQPGRYQSPLIESIEDLQVFFYTFQTFLEGDGRHHIWIGSPSGDGLLVYDQHNVLFAYGDVEQYEAVLKAKQYQRREFWFPAPHGHSYPAENAKHEDELLRYFPWEHSPLEEGDEWE